MIRGKQFAEVGARIERTWQHVPSRENAIRDETSSPVSRTGALTKNEARHRRQLDQMLQALRHCVEVVPDVLPEDHGRFIAVLRRAAQNYAAATSDQSYRWAVDVQLTAVEAALLKRNRRAMRITDHDDPLRQTTAVREVVRGLVQTWRKLSAFDPVIRMGSARGQDPGEFGNQLHLIKDHVALYEAEAWFELGMTYEDQDADHSYALRKAVEIVEPLRRRVQRRMGLSWQCDLLALRGYRRLRDYPAAERVLREARQDEPTGEFAAALELEQIGLLLDTSDLRRVRELIEPLAGQPATMQYPGNLIVADAYRQMVDVLSIERAADIQRLDRWSQWLRERADPLAVTEVGALWAEQLSDAAWELPSSVCLTAGDAERRQGHWEAAAAWYRRSQQAHDRVGGQAMQMETSLLIARCLLHAGQLAEAERAYHAHEQTWPEHPTAATAQWARIALLAQRLGKTDSAAAEYEDALRDYIERWRTKSDEPERAAWYLAQWLQSQQRHAECVALVQQQAPLREPWGARLLDVWYQSLLRQLRGGAEGSPDPAILPAAIAWLRDNVTGGLNVTDARRSPWHYHAAVVWLRLAEHDPGARQEAESVVDRMALQSDAPREALAFALWRSRVHAGHHREALKPFSVWLTERPPLPRLWEAVEELDVAVAADDGSLGPEGVAMWTDLLAAIEAGLRHNAVDHNAVDHNAANDNTADHNNASNSPRRASDHSERTHHELPSSTDDVWHHRRRYVQARLWQVERRGQEALRELRALHQAAPEEQRYAMAFADALIGSETPAAIESGLELWRRLMVLLPVSGSAWYRAKFAIASAHARLGDRERACQIARLTLRLYPDSSENVWRGKLEALEGSCGRRP